MKDEKSKIIAHVICTYCACTCDDIVVTVESDQITHTQHTCTLGEAWFGMRSTETRPVALLGGRAAALDEAVAMAAQVLNSARSPVIYGLGETTCEAQQQAVALADLLGATIDTPVTVTQGLSGLAFQGMGKSTATFGEVRNRSDLIIYWGANPVETHPRHLERFVAPKARRNRTVIVIDTQRTRTAEEADLFVQIKPDSDFELLWALRALLKGKPIDAGIEQSTGVSLAAMTVLLEQMKSCHYGAFFFGTGLLQTRAAHYNADALLALTADLNQYTRFVALPAVGNGNTSGANNVLAWQTGYPFAVNFSRSFPRSNPGEFSVNNMLARGEADAALIIASDPAGSLSAAAMNHLKHIPTIVLHHKPTAIATTAKVAFTSATYGIHNGGTVYRMDDVSLALRPPLTSTYPTDEAILTAIKERVLTLKGIG